MNNYTGNPLQTRGAEKYTLQGGAGNGMNFLYVRNGLGLEAWISVDRAADVSRVIYNGDNMGFFSPCGYVAPQYYDKKGLGFLKSFTGGFFTTCGLTTVGSPCTDDGEELPLHGTVSHIPAVLNGIEENETELKIKFTITDAVIFGRKLVMNRTYVFSYTENSFSVNDRVTNAGDITSPYMILYHCNMGYPLLCEDSIIKIPHSKMVARDEHARKFIDTALTAEKPQPQFQERCYFYDVLQASDKAQVGIFNQKTGKGVIISYNKSELPCFTEWKMMGQSDYVLGLEPGNCNPIGRAVARENGTLQFLEPGESKKASVMFNFANENEFKEAF